MELDDLKTLRCPQNWDFNHFQNIEDELLKKRMDFEDEPLDTTYGSKNNFFLHYFLLSYEVYRKEEYKRALEYLEKSNVMDDFIKRYERVFKHVIAASKAYILYKMNSIEESKTILNELKYQSYSKTEEAGFKYVKSRLECQYGEKVCTQAIDLIESAIEIVPDEAEFNFSLGFFLTRRRHYTYPAPPPTQKEFDACRKAVSLRRDNPWYSISLARIYMEVRHSLPYNKKKEYGRIAASLYRNLLQHCERLSGNDIARCIFNLIKVDSNCDLEKYAKIALKKSDSILTNHYIGIFYLRNHQFEEAYECFKKIYITQQDIPSKLFLLKYRISGNSLSVDEMESFITEMEKPIKSESESCQINFYLGASEFYLAVKDDHNMASKYFLFASKLDITEPYYMGVCSYVLQNYLFILQNELGRRSKSLITSEALKALKELPKKVFNIANRKSQKPYIFEIQQDLRC